MENELLCEALVRTKEVLSKMIFVGKLSEEAWNILREKMTRKEKGDTKRDAQA